MREQAYRNRNTGRDGWYTPREIIEVARETMGGIGIKA